MARPKVQKDYEMVQLKARTYKWIDDWMDEQDVSKSVLVTEALLYYYPELSHRKPKRVDIQKLLSVLLIISATSSIFPNDNIQLMRVRSARRELYSSVPHMVSVIEGRRGEQHPFILT